MSDERTQAISSAVRLFYVFAYLVSVIFDIASVSMLPSRVATHFNALGQPDTWSTPRKYVEAMLAIKTFFFILFLLLPRLLAITPPQFVNLPNREHWLAPERIAVTQNRLTGRFYVMGTGLFVFLLVMSWLVVRANIRATVEFENTLALVALLAFLAFTLAWVVCLFAAFRKPR